MKKMWAAFSLLLALSLLLSGCGNEITAEEIAAKVRETIENTEDAHAVITVDMSVQGMDLSAKAEIWEKSPDKFRMVVLESSEPALVGTLAVNDGQQAWYYDPTANRVQVDRSGKMQMPLPQEVLGSLQEAIQQVLDASNVELAGEETVAGREAYKLILSPREGASQELFPGSGTTTLWVDKEQWFVLRATYAADAFGQGSMEVQSFELNAGLADDLFSLTVPEGAEVEEAQFEEPQYLTLKEAKEQAAFELLVPEYVPEGMTLVEVYKVKDTIYLSYHQPPQNGFTIMQGLTTPGATDVSGPSQQITVRGHDATLVTDEAKSNTFLSWDESGVLTVLAGNISPDEAIKVAESLR